MSGPTVLRLRRTLLAALTGGSIAGLVAVHAVHAAAMAGAPMVVQFVCSIAR
jgi:hypothetical protein